MAAMQIDVPPQVLQRIEEYRRQCGQHLGIATIEANRAMINLIERGLRELLSEGETLDDGTRKGRGACAADSARMPSHVHALPTCRGPALRRHAVPKRELSGRL